MPPACRPPACRPPAETMLCSACGAPNGPTDRFCVSCGAGLGTAATAPGPSGTGPLPYGPSGPDDPISPAGAGFFAALFDLSFASFVTPRLIKVLYVLVMVGLALTWLIFVIAGFHAGALEGLLALVGGGILAMIYLLVTRVVLEFCIAVFRIADDVQVLRRRQGT